MKNEMFYGRDYTNATLDELEAKMDEYIVWHNEKRQKRSLGSMSSLHNTGAAWGLWLRGDRYGFPLPPLISIQRSSEPFLHT
ncbi:IS3 family transposase [Atopobium sp. oral taxon 416]|nr:IS3 family transposase [Atopobium sp. oral taxon 416]